MSIIVPITLQYPTKHNPEKKIILNKFLGEDHFSPLTFTEHITRICETLKFTYLGLSIE